MNKHTTNGVGYGVREAVFGFSLVVVMMNIAAVSPALADTKVYTGEVRGLAVERIDSVDHAVERVVGRPDGRTTADQLKLADVVVAPEDRVQAFPDPSLGLGSAIVITRATVVHIIDGKKSSTVRTWTTTVNDVLGEQHVELGKDDTVDVDKISALVDNMTITITRVEVTEVQETESVAYSKESVNDATMEKGQTKVIQSGKNGVRTKTYRVRRENGEEVERKLIKNEVTTAPVTEKTAIGTKVVVYATGKATWYGLKHGMGAASNTLPYGTKIHVVNTANGKTVDVTINDHGIQGDAIIDLDAEAFQLIGTLGQGIATVRLEKYYGN